MNAYYKQAEHWQPAENVGVVVAAREGVGGHSEVREWQGLEQVHGSVVHRVGAGGVVPTRGGESQSESGSEILRGDGLYTTEVGVGLFVRTADCLPVFLLGVDSRGQATEVGIVHAGWRGLAAGVVENGVGCFSAAPASISAFLGPAIGPCHFEVGEDVYAAFQQTTPQAEMAACFRATGSADAMKETGKFMADLFRLAAGRLRRAGVTRIAADTRCTYCHSDNLYSYRRDKGEARMVNGIYLRF